MRLFRVNWGFMRKIRELEGKIGYCFQDQELLKHALRHSSYVNEKHMKKHECNERLEFLGDAVLEVVSSEFLFFEHQTMPEGELTKKRASMVCEPALAFCARDIDLGGISASWKGRRGDRRKKERFCHIRRHGGVDWGDLSDGGFASAKEFIHRFILNDLENKKLFLIARLSCRKSCREVPMSTFPTS